MIEKIELIDAELDAACGGVADLGKYITKAVVTLSVPPSAVTLVAATAATYGDLVAITVDLCSAFGRDRKPTSPRFMDIQTGVRACWALNLQQLSLE